MIPPNVLHASTTLLEWRKASLKHEPKNLKNSRIRWVLHPSRNTASVPRASRTIIPISKLDRCPTVGAVDGKKKAS